MSSDTRIVRPACPIIGFGAYGGDNGVVDVWAEDEAALRLITEAIDKQPLACACLAQLLRHNAHANVPDGLFAESLTYSTLQQSLGFRAWQNERTDPSQNAEPAQGTEPVIVERTGANLNITLNRPRQHNAYSSQMRDDLCAALHLAHTDTTITEVVLAGNGPSFCAGGDLGEFGQVTDAAQAHLSRTTRSAGYLLATLPTQATVKLHGACIGAGIEVPAFANQLQATPETFFQLPEVTFGLVPGAGGTVSVCQRIGPTRTNYMAITGSRIDTTTEAT